MHPLGMLFISSAQLKELVYYREKLKFPFTFEAIPGSSPINGYSREQCFKNRPGKEMIWNEIISTNLTLKAFLLHYRETRSKLVAVKLLHSDTAMSKSALRSVCTLPPPSSLSHRLHKSTN